MGFYLFLKTKIGILFAFFRRLRVDKSKRRHHGAFRQLMFNNHDDYSLKVSQGITL